MRPAQQIRATEEEYLALERTGLDKHELLHGEIVAMAGGSPKHNAITSNVSRALGNRVAARGCLVFSSDQRIHIEGTGLYTYADVSVTCDKPRFHPKHPDNLLNPKVIVEVLSGSTEGYDHGAKFAHYQRLASLAEYVLVAQDERRVDHYRRLETGQWLLTVHEGDAAVVALPALGCEVSFGEIYENVERLDGEREGGEG
jgi:Uma2 family endonuclease